jgi:outer membrane lipoprotein SlyB
MKKFIVAIALTSVISSQAVAQNKTRQGAVVGGLTGAVIGGVIGHQNKETPEGALIGGAVGAIAGGVIGNVKDKQIAKERYYQHELHMQQHQIYAQQQQLNTTQRSGVTMADVITMSRSGVGDSVIMNHIQTKGVERRLEVSEIIYLHQQGVSEGVISTLQNAPLNSRPQVSTYSYPVRQPTNIIIHENVPTYTPPRGYYNQGHYHSNYYPSYRRPF